MAGETFSVTLQCKVCGDTLTVNNASEAIKAIRTGKHYQCRCGQIVPFEITSMWMKHSADIGAYSKITMTVADGVVGTSTPSEHIA